MEKLLIGCIFAVCSAASTAEPQSLRMPVICDDTMTMLNKLQDEFKEEVVLYADGEDRDDGKASNIVTSIWINKEKGTLSVVKTYIAEKVSCLVAMGVKNKYKHDGVSL